MLEISFDFRNCALSNIMLLSASDYTDYIPLLELKVPTVHLSLKNNNKNII